MSHHQEEKPVVGMTRRQMLASAAAVGLSVAVSALYGCGSGGTTSNVVTPVSEGPVAVVTPSPSPTPKPVVPAFVQPPVRASADGLLDTTVHAKMASNTLNGKTITTRTYEGSLVGPTLTVKPGETLRFKLLNDMPPNPDQNVVYPDMNTPHHFNTTNNHVHGLHVSPSGNSDNVLLEVVPGTSFQYEYKLPADHPPGTYWYHPHNHGAVSMQMFGGMGGALIVKGGMDDTPLVAQMRDLVFFIGELNINPATGMVPDYVPGPNGNPFSGANRTLLVNGTVAPTLTALPGEIVRLRIINGTVRTTVPFFIDGHDLDIAALDGVTLPQVQHSTVGVSIPAGGRADVFVRASTTAKSYSIKKLVDNTNTNPDAQVILGQFLVAGPQVSMTMPTTLPVPASLPDIKTAELTGKRTLTFAVSPNGGPPGPPANPVPAYPNFTIDGVRFDSNVVNQTINLNAVEEWTLVNTSATGHPFHIHINPFQVVAVNGVPLPQPEWHDTIVIPKKSGNTNGTVTIRSRFVDFTGLYVLHCHILVHEDVGMMQLVQVI